MKKETKEKLNDLLDFVFSAKKDKVENVKKWVIKEIGELLKEEK